MKRVLAQQKDNRKTLNDFIKVSTKLIRIMIWSCGLLPSARAHLTQQCSRVADLRLCLRAVR